MNVRLQLEYPGIKELEGEHPGTLTKAAGLPQVPAIGEGVALGGLGVATVAWVLWRLDGTDPEVHLEWHPAYRATVPSRAQLAAAGWQEI